MNKFKIYPCSPEPRSFAELRAALEAAVPAQYDACRESGNNNSNGSDELFPSGFKEPMTYPGSATLGNAVAYNAEVRPCSDAGRKLVKDLTSEVVGYQCKNGLRQNSRGPVAMEKLEDAVGALVGSVLRAWSRQGGLITKVPCRAKAYTGRVPSYRVVMEAMDALWELDFVHHALGYLDRTTGAGRMTRIWPTVSLIRRAVRAGMTSATIKQHFARSKALMERALPPEVPAPVELRGLSSRPGKRDGTEMPFEPDHPVWAAIRADVEAHNRFAAATRIGGCRPPRWCRKFKLDQDLHGRWYVPGDDSYQSMPANERLEITIAGEAVVEIDVKASLISLLHGVLGLPLPTDDPYCIPGVPRDVVKAWINATLGKGSPVSRWSKETIEDQPAVVEHDAYALGKLVIARHPFLAEPWRAAQRKGNAGEPKRVLHHLLTGIEAAILSATMAALRDKMILSLPMHDGLIVPVSAEALACRLLIEAGERIAGVTLRLDVERPPSAL